MKYLFFFAITIVSCTEKKSGSTHLASTPVAFTPKSSMKIRMINPKDLKIGSNYSTPVISAAQKFIILIPKLGITGEPLIYPTQAPKAGQPILDYQGHPIGERGIIFFNDKDQSWQAAAGDEQSVIIINEVTHLQADKLYQKVNQLQHNPNKLTLSQLKEVLTYAQQDLKLKDIYNSTRAFVEEKMTSVNLDKSKLTIFDNVYGFKKRDDRDVNQAIYIPGKFSFQGPAASAQKFSNGGVIVEQEGAMRGIQPEIFKRTYTLANGNPIRSLENDIKKQFE